MSYWRNIETDPPPAGELVLLSFDKRGVVSGTTSKDGEWYGMFNGEPPKWWAPMPADTAPAPPAIVEGLVATLVILLEVQPELVMPALTKLRRGGMSGGPSDTMLPPDIISTAPPQPQRYCLVTDDQEPSQWACPVERRDELRAMLRGRWADSLGLAWAKPIGATFTFTDPRT